MTSYLWHNRLFFITIIVAITLLIVLLYGRIIGLNVVEAIVLVIGPYSIGFTFGLFYRELS